MHPAKISLNLPQQLPALSTSRQPQTDSGLAGHDHWRRSSLSEATAATTYLLAKHWAVSVACGKDIAIHVQADDMPTYHC